MNKVLTVSIASFNVEKTLERTLDSILTANDCLPEIEIIVVNDGSNDKTQEIGQRYEEKFLGIVKIINKPNGGYGSTINESLALSNGKYYKLLDGDDTFVTENIADYIQFLKTCEADLVISPYNIIRADNGEIKFMDNHSEEADVQDYKNILMHEISVKTGTLRTNRTNITENCFYTDNEFVFYSLMGMKTAVKYKKPIYNYYLGVEGQSVSVEGYRKHYKDLIIVADKICQQFCTLVNSSILDNKNYNLITEKIIMVVRTLYDTFLLLENMNEAKKELIEYDRNLKNRFPLVYQMTGDLKKIKLLRKTRFITFYFLSMREKMKR